jgi:hypothetical protein
MNIVYIPYWSNYRIKSEQKKYKFTFKACNLFDKLCKTLGIKTNVKILLGNSDSKYNNI